MRNSAKVLAEMNKQSIYLPEKEGTLAHDLNLCIQFSSFLLYLSSHLLHIISAVLQSFIYRTKLCDRVRDVILNNLSLPTDSEKKKYIKKPIDFKSRGEQTRSVAGSIVAIPTGNIHTECGVEKRSCVCMF